MAQIGICRICGDEANGIRFSDWVKDTFTNHDLLRPGEIICDRCLFWFDQRSVELQERMGKDKPQKMQNYSHFVMDGKWEPVGKGDKRRMAALLLDSTFPEMAAIAVSGQKHLAFRARRNPPGQAGGWVQFEEQEVWIEQKKLREVLHWVETLYQEFTKGEIESGQYAPRRIMAFGVDRWKILEEQIKPIRSTELFQLALYLAQRSEDGNGKEFASDDGDAVEDHLERDSIGLQEPVSDDDLESIRERDSERSVHGKPGEVRQYTLF